MTETPGPRRTESERLVDAITADIQSGSLAPGLWLKQIDIENRYRVTRNIARAALLKLAAHRYIEHAPNRGYRIPAIEGPRRLQLLRVRAILEGSLAPDIVAGVTDPAIDELHELAAEFTALLDTGAFMALIEANAAFHARMQMLAANTEQIRLIQELRQSFRPYPGMTWDSPATMRRSAAEHHQMVEALQRRDADGLAALIVQHIGKGEIGPLRIVHFQSHTIAEPAP